MAVFADKSGGDVERKNWEVRGHIIGGKQKRKQQKYKWSKQKNLHFRLSRKKKTGVTRRFLAFFSVFWRFLAFFSVF